MWTDIPLDVVFYRTDLGNEPVREWLRGMSKADKRVIGNDIKTVQYGWPIGMPVVRKLGYRALGGPITVGSAYQSDSVHGARRHDDFAAWFCQEVTEDPEGGSATGEGPQSQFGEMT